MHLHILVRVSGSHIGLYGNLQISDYSYNGTSNIHVEVFSELLRIIVLQGGKFSLNRWWMGKFQMQRRVKFVMSCKPILDHEKVIRLETFLFLSLYYCT